MANVQSKLMRLFLSLHKRENPVTIDQPKGASGIDGSKAQKNVEKEMSFSS
jgi:hypothetical protein